MANQDAVSRQAAMLEGVPLLSGLTQEQLKKVAATGDERMFRSGETIVKEGDKGPGLYLIRAGGVEVRRSGDRIASLSVGQFFGESALLVDEPRTADVRATTEVRCFALNRWDFWSAMGIDPQRNRALYEETVQRLKTFQSKPID
ncbi:MAG: cyclic nucleotide-binding domain-containing protein [Thermoplasmata archaeon]